MESFDQSLKYLLQHQPADFIRFGLGDPAVEVLAPLPSGLPARGRDVDGGYLIARGDERRVVHIEFHRRHQSLDELAIDVAEVQIRMFRRERLPVSSLVWDLYGKPHEPVLESRTLSFGAPGERVCSQCVYQRVNLRGLGWEQFLNSAPAALWPLVPLTRDGTNETAVLRARDAIEGQAALSGAEQADHLAVLWFMAGAEGLPVEMVKSWISEGRLMESELYRSVVEKGELNGMRETIIRILMRRMGALDMAIREKIRALSDIDLVRVWYDEALGVVDAEGARKLAETIQRAPVEQTGR
ncbi:MAG TPA: hypothetical protein VLS89_19710 [Candidatus Nanopelagicales bacterium]|nr:hypothetical protein [Candidatus Nanopelagicales bacterium]